MLVQTADHTNQPIFPEYQSPTEWPWTLSIVVGEARRILEFFKLPTKAQPPKAIWHSSEKCAEFVRKALDVTNAERPMMLEFSDSEIEGT